MPDRPLAALREQVGEDDVTVEGLTVEPGKVAEFAAAVTDADPVHHDAAVARERGFDAVPAPLTFTRLGLFDRYRPPGVGVERGFDLGLDHPHVVHGEQAYAYDRPPVAGDTLTGTTTLADVTQREGSRGGTLTFVELETAYRDDDGEPVLTEYVTLIETGGGIDDGPDGPDDPDGAYVAEEGPAETRRSDRPHYGETPTPSAVSAGTTGPELVVEDVGREDFVRYAGASGDFNTIHYAEPYARAAGNPTVFGQGMYTAGVAAHLVSGWLGLAAIQRFRTRFENRLWPASTLIATGEVTEVTPDGGESLVDVSVTVTDDDDRVLVTGDATAALSAE